MEPKVFAHPTLYVEQWGERGERVILIHGGNGSGANSFQAQKPLAERWTLLLPDRPGTGKSPDIGTRDFERDAAYIVDLMGEGAHVVGHSYGGIVALYAAALRPAGVRSLTVIEPPMFGIVQGDPDVDAMRDGLIDLWTNPPDPETFLRRFFVLSGAVVTLPPSPLPPRLITASLNMLTIRPPWEATIPTGLDAAPFQKLVITGGHSRAYDVVAEGVAAAIGAARQVIAGNQHSVQDLGAPFNEALEAFWRT
ncbi:MAG: alpha/beta hydrolase family protein [Chloroflexota bacterium]|nr:alpha/beta hydrolase family protein [Chloroflexota bacterium]